MSEPQIWRTKLVDTPFIVCAMFTKSYLDRAERLLASLENVGLSYAIYEVPTVHRSISPKGTDDLAFCKPRFISWALRQAARPILYVDVDCVFKERPELIWELRDQNMDFAIYNWLFDLMNDAWLPVEEGQTRYWRFNHSIDEYSSVQLHASGAVQYWSNSVAALNLLEAWELQLTRFPDAPDDECLDYAFNIEPEGKDAIRYFWLPKEYARYAFWIYARPVIDHPDLPTAFPIIRTLGRYHPSLVVKAEKARPIARACIVDAEEKLLLIRKQSGEWAPAGYMPINLYL
jgi:hypothetical protein